jgi:hypothetical protein
VFAVFIPKARIWAISPTLETGDELDEALKEMLPRRWYRRRQAKTGRATTYTLANGSRILLKSAVKPAAPQGRARRPRASQRGAGAVADGLPEAPRRDRRSRRPRADRGEPARDAIIGKWVEKTTTRREGGEIPCVVFELDPRNNPWIKYEALALDGLARPTRRPTSATCSACSRRSATSCSTRGASANWRDPPARPVDITAR